MIQVSNKIKSIDGTFQCFQLLILTVTQHLYPKLVTTGHAHFITVTI